ncbi:MAG: tRNA lysidine(34) synthetase TilS, partial [Oscillospiraceae bacterium]|nr:tRNA lysidine(34) synthetase TilS [Oscillospiraceae bacterium]
MRLVQSNWRGTDSSHGSQRWKRPMRQCDPVQAVRTFLKENDIRNVSVTAALSGGADSVCLLYCLLQCRTRFELSISALHVQHNLRGTESVRDENFCRALCADWDVPLTVVSVDVAAMQENGMSTEEAARECRYRVFACHKSDYIATAHTASDNFETMLFRLARGTGLKGLSGIPPQRERYLRPLLRVTREQVENCLRVQGIAYVTDSSNLTDDYTRNFLRHQVVPLLREQNPALDRTAAETAEILRTEEDFLSQAAQAAYTAARQPDGSLIGLSTLHPALQRRCIRLFLEAHGLSGRYTAVTTVQALLAQGGRVELNRDGVWVCVSRGGLFI